MELEPQQGQQQQSQTNIFELTELFQTPQFYENIPQDDIIDRRIECIGSYGNVKYLGKLQHYTQEELAQKSEADKNQIWVGIEWDETNRGRHNGTVNNFQYFKTSDNKNSATLLKIEKTNFGVSIFDGIILKYFRGSPEQVKVQLMQKYQENQQKKLQSENQMQIEETKITEKKPVTVEYDEDAYFETTQKHIKKVEFLGFDVIWEKINNLYEIKELSLQEMQISNLGPYGGLGKLTPQLAVLSIEKNLLFDWNQVYQIGLELKNLRSLSLSGNIMRKPQNVLDMKNIKIHFNNILINVSPVNIFENLTALVLMDMKLTWKDISNILPTVPVIVELLLCRNYLNDFENIIFQQNQLQYLEYINLEENEITSFEGMKIFQNLPRFQKLNLNKNFLTELGKFENFNSMDFVSLNNNLIEDCKIYSQLAQFKFLTQLRFQNNLIDQKFEKHYLRQRAIAEIKNLEVINGSDLKQYERKDCEIFYLRRTFEDYFKLKNRPHYDYDFEDCVQWCDQFHPRIRELIKKYGNPYELDTRVEEKKEIPKNPNQTAKKNVVELNIRPYAGPLQGQLQKKKFPDTTTVQTLKNVLAKLIQIPQENQIIYYENKHDEQQVRLEITGDYKNFINFQVKDGGDLIVDDKTVNNYKIQ